MIKGIEFHNIIGNIFDGNVRGLYENEQLQVCCPVCQERDNLDSPDGKYNLEINTEKEIFKCWKCEEPKFKGRLGRLIKKEGGEYYYDLYKSYTQIKDFNYDPTNKEVENVDVVRELPPEFISFKKMDVKNSEHNKAYNYMVFDRKISYNKMKKYNIGFCVDGKYSGRVVIPSYDEDGDINYFVSRTFVNHKRKYMNPKVNKSNIIFNEGIINWDSTVYLVEGGFDMLVMPPNVIPLLGKNIYDKLFFKLRETKPYLIIVLDPDAYLESIKIIEKLKIIYGSDSYKVKFVKLNNDEDIDEISRKYGKDEVIKKLYSARDINIDDVFMENKYKSCFR